MQASSLPLSALHSSPHKTQIYQFSPSFPLFSLLKYFTIFVFLNLKLITINKIK